MLKRAFDFSLAMFGLCIFFPFMAIICLLIFLDSGTPIFYIKRSLGRDGRVFNEIKFRSMKSGTLEITRSGAMLRQIAMDELPQLINILKGEMSFVGPRSYGVEKYGLSKDFSASKVNMDKQELLNNHFLQRLSVMPGLTGLAQVFAPKHASDAEVLGYDLRYIREKSFLLDLWIIFMSIWITVNGNWERSLRKL